MIGTLRKQNARSAAEGGGWLVVRRPQPDLHGKTFGELLALGKPLPGNLRYVVETDGKVWLHGEVRNLGGGATRDEAEARMAQWLEPSPWVCPAQAVEEAVEAALESTAWQWSKREKNWAVPANASLPRELLLRLGDRGVRVEAVLSEWDEPSPTVVEALTRFLLHAQAGLRCARCEIDGNVTRIVSLVDFEQIDAELVSALQGVGVAVRLLIREVAALQNAEAAEAYLTFHGEEAAPQK
jgi:hypothetical protein